MPLQTQCFVCNRRFARVKFFVLYTKQIFSFDTRTQNKIAYRSTYTNRFFKNIISPHHFYSTYYLGIIKLIFLTNGCVCYNSGKYSLTGNSKFIHLFDLFSQLFPFRSSSMTLSFSLARFS